MAINRFDTRTPYDWNMDYLVPQEFIPDFKAWDEVLARLQTEKDTADLIADKVPQHYAPKDATNVANWRAKIDAETSAIADLYSGQKISDARKRQNQLVRKIGRDFQPGGEAANYEANLKSIMDYQKSLDDNKELDSLSRQRGLQYSLEQFPGTINPEGGFNTFSGRPMANFFDLTKSGIDTATGWASDKYPKGIFDTGDGRFIDLSTMETVSPKEVMQHVYTALGNNPMAKAFLHDRAELFGEDPNMLLQDAARIAAEKVGFTKIDPKLMVNPYTLDDHKSANRLKENSVVSFDRAAAGLPTPMPWDQPTAGSVKEYIQSNNNDIQASVNRFIAATNLNGAERTAALQNLTGKDFATDTWYKKLGFDTAEIAMQSLAISSGIIEGAKFAYESKSRENAVAQSHLTQAQQNIDPILKKSVEGIKADGIAALAPTAPTSLTTQNGTSYTKNQLLDLVFSGAMEAKASSALGYDIKINGERVSGKDYQQAVKFMNEYNSFIDDKSSDLKRYNKKVDENLDALYISKASPIVTTDMPIVGDQAKVNSFRKGLKQEAATPGPGVLAYLPGSSTPVPLVDLLKQAGMSGATVGDNIGWSKNMHNGVRTWEINYAGVSGTGDDKKPVTLTVYVPVEGPGAISNPDVREYLNQPEVKAQNNLDFAAAYNLDNYEVPDAEGVVINNNGTVTIKGTTSTDAEARMSLEDYYEIVEVQKRFNLKTFEDAVAVSQALKNK